MQSVQRHFGRYMKRSADEHNVAVLLKDFEDAERLLTKIIDASKAWRESWVAILTHQHRIFEEFEVIYAPIIGAGDDYHGHVPQDTPDHLVRRTNRLKADYEELKKDLTQDLTQVEDQVIRPAQTARDHLLSMKKTIRKREDKKLDYERYQSRVDSASKKTKRSERETAAFAKAQSDLTTATDAYHAADHHLLSCLPPLVTSIFSLTPHFLASQICIQNALLGHYYTILHAFCSEEGFPSPSPPMDEVIRIWEDSFKPIQNEAEALLLLAHGKAVKLPMGLEQPQNGHAHLNGHRRPSATSAFSRTQSVSPARALPPPSPQYDLKPKVSSSPGGLAIPTPQTPSEPVLSPSPSHSAYQTPMSSYAPAGPNSDYFSRDRQPSSTSLSSITSGLLQKKRPPPPPPPRLPSQQALFVTALYDFDGQSDGDLVFKEGDKIRVMKKTDSTDDWWQGELRGAKGPFPANYCQ